VKARVWFTRLSRGETQESVARKAVRLAELAGLKKLARPGAFVGILQHVGEGRGIGYVKPSVTRALALRLAASKAKPFLTGSATLYKGSRSNACDHSMQAFAHGFTPETIRCPIVMSDGLKGTDRISVRVRGARHCGVAYLGSAVALMDGLVVVTHPTGHIAAGFGATLKNIAMGLSARGGKLAMHHGGHPVFRSARCVGCGRCQEWCPVRAIVVRKKARLLVKKCIGCGQCYAVCPADAIAFEWTYRGPVFQERLVEYAAAVLTRLGQRMVCLNVCQYFTKECDCFDIRQEALCADVGILSSRDPVALDTATADLLEETAGRDIVLEAGGREYRGMFEYAEMLGLGTRAYRLVEV